MDNVLKISEGASLAMHAMTLMASSPDVRHSMSEMARTLKASPGHLQMVLWRLARNGLLDSSRGPNGGYSLAKKPEKISLLDVYEAVEGKFRPADCLMDRPICGREKCILGELIKSVNKQTMDYFSKTTLADLAEQPERRTGK